MTVAIEDIHAARELLKGQLVRTPMMHAPKLCELTGADIWVKYENMQPTNSFKVRGAYVRLSKLTNAQKKKGVIAISAGNHAQAVAYHAKRLSIPATIVMPRFTPFIKVEQTRSYGAEIVLAGETLDDTRPTVEKIISQRGLTLIHPYDDDHVIAGQGTIALEMLEEVPDLEALVIPIGGGGILAGNAISSRSINPDIELIGVEASLYPSMYNAIRAKKMKCGGSTLADGIAVKTAGEKTSTIIGELVNDIRLVSESEIERAVSTYFCYLKSCAEGAGAISLAAVMADREYFAGRTIGLILSGGNIDPRIMASIIYRELKREQRIVNIRLIINDRPGVLASICTVVGESGANILEVAHSRMFLDVPANGAELDLMIETRGPAHVEQLVGDLKAAGYQVALLDAPGGKASSSSRAR